MAELLQRLQLPAAALRRGGAVEGLPGFGFVASILRLAHQRVAQLPAHPHGVADHHIQGQIIFKAHAGIGGHKGDQGEQRLRAELPVFRSLDLAQQLLHQRREIALARSEVIQQRRTLQPVQQRRALQSVAALQFVADHDAAAMVQQIPDARIKITRHPLQGAQAQAVLQPAAALGQLLQGIGHLPAHPGTLQVQLLLPLQRRLGVLHIGQHNPQAAADGMGRQAAKLLKGVTRTQVGPSGQLAGEQQQQLPQLHGEAAAEQAGLQPRQAVDGQQQLLLQHPLAGILPAEAPNHRPDHLAALGLADQRLAGVVAAHHHLLLPHQQIRERILQLGVHQAHHAGGAAHHTPVALPQPAPIHLLQQVHQPRRRAVAGTPQLGAGAQTAPQQLQHLRLLLQRRARPEPLDQLPHGGVFQLLLLAGRERLMAQTCRQQRLAEGKEPAGRHGLRRQVDPTGLGGELLQPRQTHGHPLHLPRQQELAQIEKGPGILLEGAARDGNQQQRQPLPPPMAPQEAQFTGHRVDQLQRIIRQVKRVFLQHGGLEGQGLPVVPVEPSRGHGFHPHRRVAAQPQPGVGAHRGHALAQLPGAGHPRAAAAGILHRQTGGDQPLGDPLLLGHQRHQHPLGTERLAPAPTDRIQIIRGDQAVQQQIRQPGEALGPEQGDVVIGLAGLAAGVASLGGNGRLSHQIKLRQQGHPLHLHAQLRQAPPPAPRLLPTLLATGGQQFVGQEEGPLALDVLKLRQFLRLIVQAAHVFDHRLVAIAAEALVAVGAPEVLADLGAGADHQILVIHGPGWIADHRQTGAVRLLAGGFPGQQAAQRAAQPHDRILGNREAITAIALRAQQVDPLQGFQGRLHHADGAGVALRQAMVALVPPFPDAVIGHAVRPGDVIHKVLHEVALVARLHHHQAGASDLGQLQQKHRRGVQLQVAPAVVRHHRRPGSRVELRVQGIEGPQAALEALHLRRLAHHRREQPPHQLQHPLLQLEGPAARPVQAPVGDRQTPNALDGVDAIAHPGVAIVAMHGVCRAGGQQPCQRMLTAENHCVDLAVEMSEEGQGLRPRCVGLDRGQGGGQILFIHRCNLSAAHPHRLVHPFAAIDSPPRCPLPWQQASPSSPKPMCWACRCV